MTKTKKCCSSESCPHELTVNYDKATGWHISTNSPVYAKIMQAVDNKTLPLSGSNYATLHTNDLLTVRNIISEMEK